MPSREELATLLHETRGQVATITARTGRSRRQVYRWREQHGLDTELYR